MGRCACGRYYSGGGERCDICEIVEAAKARIAAREAETVAYEEMSPEWQAVSEAIMRDVKP